MFVCSDRIFRFTKLFAVNWDIRSSHVAFISNTFAGRSRFATISITDDNHLVQSNIIQLNGNTLGTQGYCTYFMGGLAIQSGISGFLA